MELSTAASSDDAAPRLMPLPPWNCAVATCELVQPCNPQSQKRASLNDPLFFNGQFFSLYDAQIYDFFDLSLPIDEFIGFSPHWGVTPPRGIKLRGSDRWAMPTLPQKKLVPLRSEASNG